MRQLIEHQPLALGKCGPEHPIIGVRTVKQECADIAAGLNGLRPVPMTLKKLQADLPQIALVIALERDQIRQPMLLVRDRLHQVGKLTIVLEAYLLEFTESLRPP